MKRRIVFDVESIGLHGQAFAVGYVYLSGDKIADQGWAYCPPESASGTRDGRAWVEENCPWAATGMSDTQRSEFQLPAGQRMRDPRELRDWFWRLWDGHRVQETELWADVPWPVEARFLVAGVEDKRGTAFRETHRLASTTREFEGPYPLFDVRSYTEALLGPQGVAGVVDADPPSDMGADPVLVHHPLCDARISAEKLLRVERLLGKCLPD